MKASDVRFTVTLWQAGDFRRPQLTADLGGGITLSLRFGITGRHNRRWYSVIESSDWVSSPPGSDETPLAALTKGLEHVASLAD